MSIKTSKEKRSYASGSFFHPSNKSLLSLYTYKDVLHYDQIQVK
jgi:hypothetical protein